MLPDLRTIKITRNKFKKDIIGTWQKQIRHTPQKNLHSVYNFLERQRMRNIIYRFFTVKIYWIIQNQLWKFIIIIKQQINSMGNSNQRIAQIDHRLIELENLKKQLAKQWHDGINYSIQIFFLFFICAFSAIPITNLIIKKLKNKNEFKLVLGTGFGKCPLCKLQNKDIIVFPCRHFSHCGNCELKNIHENNTCTFCNNKYLQTIKIYV